MLMIYHIGQSYVKSVRFDLFNTNFLTSQYQFSILYLPTQKQLKPLLHASFQNFRFTNINNHLICFEKKLNTYLKAKNTLHTTQISGHKYVFIVFSKKDWNFNLITNVSF